MTDLTDSRPEARPVLRRTPDNLVSYRAELDQYMARFREFSKMEPEEVLLDLSAISSRLMEIRSKLVRSEDRVAQKLRTMEVDPLGEHVKLLFQIHSRLIACRLSDRELM